MAEEAAIASLAIPFGHVADLFLAVAELFLLWKAVTAWNQVIRGYTAISRRECPDSHIPRTGVIGTAKELVEAGTIESNGWSYTPISYAWIHKPNDCTGKVVCDPIKDFCITGWEVRSPFAGTDPKNPQFCTWTVDSPDCNGNIQVTENNCA